MRTLWLPPPAVNADAVSAADAARAHATARKRAREPTRKLLCSMMRLLQGRQPRSKRMKRICRMRSPRWPAPEAENLVVVNLTGPAPHVAPSSAAGPRMVSPASVRSTSEAHAAYFTNAGSGRGLQERLFSVAWRASATAKSAEYRAQLRIAKK